MPAWSGWHDKCIMHCQPQKTHTCMCWPFYTHLFSAVQGELAASVGRQTLSQEMASHLSSQFQLWCKLINNILLRKRQSTVRSFTFFAWGDSLENKLPQPAAYFSVSTDIHFKTYLFPFDVNLMSLLLSVMCALFYTAGIISAASLCLCCFTSALERSGRCSPWFCRSLQNGREPPEQSLKKKW